MSKFGFLFLLCVLTVAVANGQQRFVASVSGAQEVPANASAGRGTCSIVLNAAETQITVNCTFSGLGSNAAAGHIHGNAVVGANAGVLFGFTGVPAATSGSVGPLNFNVTPTNVADMRAHRFYVNIHSVSLPGGEIRGQIKQVQTVSDFDGDGRSDATIFRQSTFQFWTLNSLDGAAIIRPFGMGTTGNNYLNNSWDFDGDGRADPLLITLAEDGQATWKILQSSSNIPRIVEWGLFTGAVGDTLAMADYDGDGIEDIAVFRRSTGDWWIIDSSTGARRVEHWGALNDFPSVGDYDGDGKADLAVVRVEGTQRVWYIRNSSTGAMRREVFGFASTDGIYFFSPIDYDGDGKQDLLVNRTIAGQRFFFIKRSSDGQVVQLQWGLSTDAGLFGDYDGDGKTDLVARRASGGGYVWYILRSSDSTVQYAFFGVTGDQLVDRGDTGGLERVLTQSGEER